MTLNPGKPLNRKQSNSLRSILTEGMVGERLIIPEFRGHVPLMAANLKRLELVDWDRIDLRWNGGDTDTEGPELVRAASTDSPFPRNGDLGVPEGDGSPRDAGDRCRSMGKGHL